MGNRTYLCSSDQQMIYPCSSEDGYDPKKHTIAMDNWAIPLTWLMLFREADIVEQPVPERGGTMTRLSAPLVASEVAIGRLPRSLAAFAAAFPDQRPLQPHCDMLADAVSSTGRRFVTIELVELEYGYSPEHFWPVFRLCLRGFENPLCSVPEAHQGLWRSIFRRPKMISWKEALEWITSLRFGIRFPPADLLHPRGHYSDDDLWNISRLFGESLYRPVPWNPPKPKPSGI